MPTEYTFSMGGSSGVIYADKTKDIYESKGYYRGGERIKQDYPLSSSTTYNLHIKGKEKDLKEKLKLGTYDFYLSSSIRPFNENTPINNQAYNRTQQGCTSYDFSEDEVRSIGLQINDLSNEFTENFERIVCVKPRHTSFVGPGRDNTRLNCTFYELKSEIKINYNINLSKGEQTRTFQAGR